MRDADLEVLFDERELRPGDRISELKDVVSSADIILVLISAASVGSQGVQYEINTALASMIKDRAIALIPALLDRSQIPDQLKEFQYLDLSSNFESGTQRLIAQIRTASEIEYSKLSGLQFEALVADLLRTLGFKIERQTRRDMVMFDWHIHAPA